MRTFIIDAFTDQPFKGNPAGVCLVEQAISVETMQAIAAELNLSETAFLTPSETDNSKYFIRYFTPKVEIDFCGHATLAAAKLTLHHFGQKFVQFETFKHLELSAVADGDFIKMKFPLYDTVPFEPSKELLEAFGIDEPLSAKFAPEPQMLLIEVKDKKTLEGLKPDFTKALAVSDRLKLLMLTTQSTDSEDSEYDFYSRCFAPWLGVNEDPVTGSAHSVLAKYWAKKMNKNEMNAYQASQRGGFMKLRILSETDLEVVSKACLVFEGKISLQFELI